MRFLGLFSCLFLLTIYSNHSAQAQASTATKTFSCSKFGSGKSDLDCYRKNSEKAREWCFKQLKGTGVSLSNEQCNAFKCTLDATCSYWPEEEMLEDLIVDELAVMLFGE